MLAYSKKMAEFNRSFVHEEKYACIHGSLSSGLVILIHRRWYDEKVR